MSDQINPSRMLARLDAEISTAPTQVEADCKRAERAAYLARLGRFEEASRVIEGLRLKYSQVPSSNVLFWINLVEGLSSHFSSMGPDARSKILRSNAIAAVARLDQLRALSLAWLSQMNYLNGDFSATAEAAKQCIILSEADNHASRSRVSLVIAQSLHLAGRLDLAAPWYKRAHSHAIVDADDATISALIHNMAWLRAQNERANRFHLTASDKMDQYSLVGAKSTENFDLLIGSISLPSLVPILRAQLLTSREDYSGALVIFETSIDSAISEGMGRLASDLLADKAWCYLKVGRVSEARSAALAAEESMRFMKYSDDRALASARLAQVHSVLGDSRAAAEWERQAQASWSLHVVSQEKIVYLFGTIQY